MSEDFTVDDCDIEEVVTAPTKLSVKPLVLLTFDRWFALQGRPAHHKLGMRAFASTKGKKTREAWDSIFENY